MCGVSGELEMLLLIEADRACMGIYIDCGRFFMSYE